MNKEYTKYLGLGLGGLTIGFGVGWFISKSVTTKKLRVILEQELKDMEGYFDRRSTEKTAKLNVTKPTPKELFEDYHGREELETITSAYRTDAEEFRDLNDGRVPTDEDLQAYLKTEDKDPDEELLELRTVSVFDSPEPEDVGPEVESPFDFRNPSKPYVIPIGDFMNPEEDFEDYDKITITYYEEDEVLTDDADKTFSDVDGTVGLMNLKKFGRNSDNPDIVYVRNERINTDFEIARVAGSYTQIVLGFDAKPSKRTQRVREDD